MMAEFTWCSKDVRRRGVLVSPLFPLLSLLPFACPSSAAPRSAFPVSLWAQEHPTEELPPPPLSGGGSGRTAMDPWPPMSTETNDVDVFPPPSSFLYVRPSVCAYVLLWMLLPQTGRPVATDAHTHARTATRLLLSADPARKTSPIAPAQRRHVTFSRIRLGGLLAAFMVCRK